MINLEEKMFAFLIFFFTDVDLKFYQYFVFFLMKQSLEYL